MDDIRRFLRNPPRFMRNNHVRYCGVYPEGAGGTHKFVLLRIGASHARRRRVLFGMDLDKTDAGEFQIRIATNGNYPYGAELLGTFDAVWSGYAPRAAVRCALVGWGADIMLTPELTGCTVVCAPQPNGGAYFSHYNLRYLHDDRTLMARDAIHQAAIDYPGSEHGVLPKEAYEARRKWRGSRARATVIGWRQGGAWTFWTQYVEEHDGKFHIRDVQQLRPGARYG